MPFPIRTTYTIERCTNGRDWAHIARYVSTSKATILKFYEAEVKANPRDWLRVVKCEETPVCEYLGDGRHGHDRK